MPAAIRPYSIAVAPDSSLAKRTRLVIVGMLLLHYCLTWAPDRHFFLAGLLTLRQPRKRRFP
jgi:hypothetical protein